MSTPGTPASSLSAAVSPRSNSDSDASGVLTPGRKVKALLAQFDDSSDSESGGNSALRSTNIPRSNNDRPRQSLVPAAANSGSRSRGASPEATTRDDEGEEDAFPFVPRGRIAARLQGNIANSSPTPSSSSDSGDGQTHQIKSARRQAGRASQETASMASSQNGQSAMSSDEGPPRQALRKRLLLKRKSSPIGAHKQPTQTSISASILSSPPPALRGNELPADKTGSSSDSENLPDNPSAGGSSRFLALVEKHRKERLAKEAAEITKKAARVGQLKAMSNRARTQRGSSPADDSDEDSDVSNSGAGVKLTKQARPTRKASKKALEEMSRETQRMSRNMQLAHQATTKKKITKESLLARFNFSVPGGTRDEPSRTANKSTTLLSPAQSSDTEAAKVHSTPPTSPIPHDAKDKDISFSTLPATNPADISVSNSQIKVSSSKGGNLELAAAIPGLDKGKGIAVGMEPAIPVPAKTESRPIRVKWTKEDVVMAGAADSDSDLEIIISTSNTRKYAIFENLPKRKTREANSHFMLRSLAHLMGDDTKKQSSVTAAEMQVSLLKAARMQARKEREGKIEELKAKGIVIQTAEERERDQQELEDIVERARQEAAEIQRREKELAKKDGTFVKDELDDESDGEEDGDFEDDEVQYEGEVSESEEDAEEEENSDGGDEEADEGSNAGNDAGLVVDGEAEEKTSDETSVEESLSEASNGDEHGLSGERAGYRKNRRIRVISDDEDEAVETNRSPAPFATAKTPRSAPRSARKVIPGLQMSDDLPMGLTQAFAATMADSQTQEEAHETQKQDSLTFPHDLPLPNLSFVPQLSRLDSIDVVTDSQPASQTQPLNVNLSFSQSQVVPQSPVTQFTPSRVPFVFTQDVGYTLSPFAGDRFGSDTPSQKLPHSTIETVILPKDGEASPVAQRRGKLRRGRAAATSSDDGVDFEEEGKDPSAFEIMRRAAERRVPKVPLDKSKSHAKDVVDEAAEESEDEYAGLGGASDDGASEEENEDDRQMIDHDTQVGKGDEAKLAGLYADRERKQDEAAVTKLLKDITTGALRRKRGVGDDLDLSDEEDQAARRREAKRREFAKMRRELLKDEAVGKIAEDKKKEAFLRSIEDRDEAEDEVDGLDGDLSPHEDDSQSRSEVFRAPEAADAIAAKEARSPERNGQKRKRPLEPASDSTMNRLPPSLRRTAAATVDHKPSTLAEIRESVSFLIEEPDSQSATIDLGLSDSEDEPEAYVNLDRHFQGEDEYEDDGEDLGDFIVDDENDRRAAPEKNREFFKKPELPSNTSSLAAKRAPFHERRTENRTNVVDRLSLIRQASSSSTFSNRTNSKMAFFTSKSIGSDAAFGKLPSLLRRATANSSFGTKAGSGRDGNVSATGVVTMTNKTERGRGEDEKEFVRRGTGGRRNAVNYRATATTAITGKTKLGDAKVGGKGRGEKTAGSGFLGALFGGNSWD